MPATLSRALTSPQVWIAAVVLMLCDGSCVPSPLVLGAARVSVETAPNLSVPVGADPQIYSTLVALLCTLVAGIAFTILSAAAEVGYLRMQRRVLEHAEFKLALLVTSFDRFFPMLGWKLTEAALTTVGLAVGALPGVVLLIAGVDAGGWLLILLAATLAVFVQVRLAFGEPLVALEGFSAISAVRESWRMTSGRQLDTLKLLVVMRAIYLAGAVGFLLFVVGALVTIPLARFAGDLVFLDTFLRARSSHERSPDVVVG